MRVDANPGNLTKREQHRGQALKLGVTWETGLTGDASHSVITTSGRRRTPPDPNVYVVGNVPVPVRCSSTPRVVSLGSEPMRNVD
jgi:hypothetical protein